MKSYVLIPCIVHKQSVLGFLIDRTMDSLGNTTEVSYNWVDITQDFFKHIQGKHLILTQNRTVLHSLLLN